MDMTWERLIEKMHKIRNDWSVIDWLYHVFYFVKDKITALEERCTALEARCTELEQKVVEIFQTLTSHENRLDSIENTQDEQEQEITELSEKTALTCYSLHDLCGNTYYDSVLVFSYTIPIRRDSTAFFIISYTLIDSDGTEHKDCVSLLEATEENGSYGGTVIWQYNDGYEGQLFRYRSEEVDDDTLNCLVISNQNITTFEVTECYYFGTLVGGKDIIFSTR